MYKLIYRADQNVWCVVVSQAPVPVIHSLSIAALVALPSTDRATREYPVQIVPAGWNTANNWDGWAIRNLPGDEPVDICVHIASKYYVIRISPKGLIQSISNERSELLMSLELPDDHPLAQCMMINQTWG